jgi:RNA polymerase sigma-70 factor (ECF subfamily)
MTVPERLLEQVLILQYQTGNTEAFERIFSRYNARLKYFLRRLSGARRDVDDLSQEVWLTVFKELGRLRNPGAFRVWLYRIARNKVFQGFRSARNAPEVADLEQIAEETETKEDFSPDDAAAIHKGLERLQEKHREVLMLRFLEEMSYEDIAQVVGVNLGTVKSRIHHAKRALREEMETLRDEKQ